MSGEMVAVEGRRKGGHLFPDGSQDCEAQEVNPISHLHSMQLLDLAGLSMECTTQRVVGGGGG